MCLCAARAVKTRTTMALVANVLREVVKGPYGAISLSALNLPPISLTFRLKIKIQLQSPFLAANITPSTSTIKLRNHSELDVSEEAKKRNKGKD